MNTAVQIIALAALAALYVTAMKLSHTKKDLKWAEVDLAKANYHSIIYHDNCIALRQDKACLIRDNKSDRDDLVSAHMSLDAYKAGFKVLLEWLHNSQIEVEHLSRELCESNEDFGESVEDMDTLISTLNSAGVSVSWKQGQDGCIVPHLNFTEHDKLVGKFSIGSTNNFSSLPKPPLSGGEFVGEAVGLYRPGDCVVCGLPKEECIGYRSGNGFTPITALAPGVLRYNGYQSGAEA